MGRKNLTAEFAESTEKEIAKKLVQMNNEMREKYPNGLIFKQKKGNITVSIQIPEIPFEIKKLADG